MDDTPFPNPDNLLSELNDDQKRAVEHEGSPLLILAGPGTGKTRVTTTKLAYLIQEKGIPPEEILALTFSEKAASEMQERVEDLLPMSSRVQIYTFHSFCLEVVRDYALELGVNVRGEVFTQEFQQAFILEHMDEFGLEHFTVPPRPMELAQTFQGAIARFKQENIPIERLEEYITNIDDQEQDEELAKLRDLARVYRAYESFKRSRGFIDFGDMQLLALKLFRNWPAAAEKYRDQYKHIIVDEFQDTDYIQLQVLLELAPEGNITVVGDDDQAIYRFRGAYLTNITEFIRAYQELGLETSQILLGTNYRCTGNIQTVAGNLIRHNPDRSEKEIEAPKQTDELVHVIRYASDREQARGTAYAIQTLHDEGAPWDSIAILARRRADARMIIEQLEKTSIPYEVLGSQQFFSIPIIRAVVSYLKVLQDPITHGPSLGHILLRPFHGLLPEEVPYLSRYARTKEMSMWESLGDLDQYDGDSSHFQAFRQFMDSLFALKGEMGLLPLVRHLILGKEFMGTALATENREAIRLLNRFLDLTTRFIRIYPDASLGEFLVHLDALRDLGIEDETKDPSSECVHLMTVHGSKGMEFPIVFVPNLGKNRFPSRFQRYKIEIPESLLEGTIPEGSPKDIHEQEERRLLYVAITRAKDSCYLSSCERYGTNVRETPQSVFLDEILQSEGGWEMLESSVLKEEMEGTDGVHKNLMDAVHHRLITSIHRGEWQKAITGLGALAALQENDPGLLEIPQKEDIEGYLSAIQLSEQKPVREHLKKIVYSPTRLGAYETCPKRYWYGYVMGIPGEWKPFFALGSAVHETIEVITKRMMDGQSIDDAEGLGILESLWDPSQYESREMERKDREDAEEMIRMFLAHQARRVGRILGVEEWVSLDLEGRRLRGKVDRIDLHEGGELEVIDYKSSKNKTSRPQLKQDFQMALYWLGVEQAYKRKVKQVGHWYLRMDSEWMVEITSEELEAVRQRAIVVIEGIEAGEFEAEPGIQTCRWCDFQMLCDERWQ